MSPSPTPTVDRFQLGLTPPLSMASFRLRSVGRSCAPLALCVAGPLRPAKVAPAPGGRPGTLSSEGGA